jgi:hypothetical protein
MIISTIELLDDTVAITERFGTQCTHACADHLDRRQGRDEGIKARKLPHHLPHAKRFAVDDDARHNRRAVRVAD